tara:strand:- start:1360 stop:1605 length:246 start_codon:yes stop_codon:yes gene_type:complete
MAKTTKKNSFPRDWNAVSAHFRNSAGAMKDKREERSGASNTNRDYIDFYLEDMEDTLENYFHDLCLDDNSGDGSSSGGEGI